MPRQLQPAGAFALTGEPAGFSHPLCVVPLLRSYLNYLKLTLPMNTSSILPGSSPRKNTMVYTWPSCTCR